MRQPQPQRKYPQGCAAADGVAVAGGEAAAVGVVVADVGGVATMTQPTWTMMSHRHHHRVVVSDGACGARDRGRCHGDYRCCGYFGDRAYDGDAEVNGVFRVAVAVGVVGVDGACHHRIPSLPRRLMT